MTISFSIDGIEEEHGYELPCPDCGLSLANAHLHHDRDFDCSCMGYGGPDKMPTPKFWLNVATENGLELLEHLGLPRTSEGQVKPHDLLTALAIKEGQDDLLTLPLSHDGRFTHNGRSLDQVGRYMVKLTELANKAAEYGSLVVWS